MVPALTPDEEIAVLRATLRSLVEKVHYTLNHPSVQGAFTMAWAHGMEYDGPTVRDEMLAAQRLLGMPDELPKPVYPERPYVLLHRDIDGTETVANIGTWKENVAFCDAHPDEEFVHGGFASDGMRKWVPPPPHVPQEVTAQMIKDVRGAAPGYDITLAECREVLVETQGNVRRSIKLVRQLYQGCVHVPQGEPSYSVTVPQIREVRNATSASTADAKAALYEAKGDVTKAIAIVKRSM
jgi:hypothetical protein